MFNDIIINKDILINNIKQVKQNNQNSLICAMVKANAYGVGQKQVVHILNDYVDFFGVACFFEAKQIKKYTDKKILIVGKLDKQDIDKTFSYTCSSLDDVKFLISKNEKFNAHLKINTGMNRFGFSSIKQFETAIKKIVKSKLVLEGVFTHFATTDNFVEKQKSNFDKFVKILNRYNLKPIIHTDNSSVQETRNHHFNMVRVGFCLYHENNNKYQPIIKIRTRIVQINKIKKDELVGYDYRFVANKKMQIAVLPIGYADGFDLRLIGFEILLNGQKCKILNICMDCCMIDITNRKIKKEDYIYIVDEYNPLKAYAEYLKVSPYQIMCNFSNMRANRLISISN